MKTQDQMQNNTTTKPMETKKQTAVEWFLMQIDLETIYKYDKLLLKAIAMEKQQIIDAIENFSFEDGEDYYNETYKK
jgi:hypothetical protein